MFDPAELPAAGWARLVAVMQRLRDPVDGCPWDLEQSLWSLKPFLVEECYEALDAIDDLGAANRTIAGEAATAPADKIAAHREELGDVLLQVVFQAQVADDLGWYDADDVATTIANKMIHRHPHVFIADNPAAEPRDGLTADGVLDQWNDIKRAENAPKGKGVLDGVPRNLPALLRGQRIGEKAARVGFDWDGAEGPLAKVDEELSELRAALAGGDISAIEHELGDILFALTSLARHAGVDAEDALRTTLDRFAGRFAYVEVALGAAGGEADSAQLEAWWQLAKKAES